MTMRLEAVPLHRKQHPGVPDADVTEHGLETSDGLSLGLTRFSRGRCRRAVILTHGLTSSREMFTMPEHLNFVTYLLDEGLTDVWVLDWRGSCRLPYNRGGHGHNIDDVAMIDLPEAVERVRALVGPDVSLHFVAHCLGALALGMSLAAGRITGLASAIAHAVFLTPQTGRMATAKLLGWTDLLATWFPDGCLPIDPRECGLRSRALPYFLLAAAMRGRCKDAVCQTLNFTYGSEQSVFRHDNLDPRTHARLGELFGPLPLSFMKHLRKMVVAGRPVKMWPGDPHYQALPDDYLDAIANLKTPCLLLATDANGMWGDANVLCHDILSRQLGRAQISLRTIVGYGHQDVFIGRNAALDVFPALVDFLRAH
jgi:Alpha/beta hydrolase family